MITFLMLLLQHSFFVIAAQEGAPIHLEVNFAWSKQEIARAFTALPRSFYIDSFDVNADFDCNLEELNHFFNTKGSSFVASEEILEAIMLLAQKNRFEKIIMTLTPHFMGYAVRLDVRGCWIFHKIKVHGFLLHKERFGSYYLLEPGNRFNLERHQESLARIKEVFKEDGYCAADIQERLEFDDVNKAVTVHLTIDRRALFSIDRIHVQVTSSSLMTKDEREKLEKKIVRRLEGALSHGSYNKVVLDQEIKDLKKYLRSKGYIRASLKVEETIDRAAMKVHLDFFCNLHRKNKTVFMGNSFFTSPQLFEQLMLFGRSALQMPSSILAAEIEDIYKKNGFLSIRVDPVDEDEKTIFIIAEGPRITIGRCKIEGVQPHFLQEVELVVSPFYKRICDESTEKGLLEAIRLWYRKKSFWDAHVDIVAREQMSPGVVALTLKIEEGKQKHVGRIEVKDFPELMELDVFAPYRDSFTPQPLDPSLLELQRKALADALVSRAILYAYPRYELIENDSVVSVVWHIQGERQPVLFGKTILGGNSQVPYERIVRELLYQEGALWDQQKVARSVEKLRALSVFESVSLYPVDMSEVAQKKDLLLTVVDGSPLDGRLRLGYQQVNNMRASTFKIGGSVIFKNPTRRADLLRLDADLTRFLRSCSFHYEIPWVYNFPIKTMLRGYVESYDQPIFMGGKDILYTADRDGFSCQFHRELGMGEVGCSSGFDWLRIRGLTPPQAESILFDPTLVGQRIPYFFFEPRFVIDYLDDSLNPSRGSLSTGAMRVMIPVAHQGLGLVRATFEQSFFFPLTNRVVGALRCRLGHVFHDNFKTLLPMERFYLGGAYSLRGFEPNMAPPLGLYPASSPVYVPIGGKTMVNINLEGRFIIRGNLGAVVFQDIGALVAGLIDGKMSEALSSATGCGLRYLTPMGPLRFDLGFKWKKRFPTDSRYAWYFTIGHAF